MLGRAPGPGRRKMTDAGFSSMPEIWMVALFCFLFSPRAFRAHEIVLCDEAGNDTLF